ncbi:MAG TPA: hypothetical protein VK563_18855, partial [Puia sp.]|nr:hypothetical protein [Puia sp.]
SRMDGQVTLGGIQYKYVERRIFNDTLEFLCIPDYAGMKLQLAGNDFCKKTGTHTGNSKIFSVDCHIVVDSFMSMEHYTVLAQPSSRYVMPILSSWASDSGQPPEHIS